MRDAVVREGPALGVRFVGVTKFVANRDCHISECLLRFWQHRQMVSSYDKKNRLDGLGAPILRFEVALAGNRGPINPSTLGARQKKGHSMKLAGFLLLLAGWVIVLSAVALLASARQQAGFVLAGLGVEAVGLVLAVRSHLAFAGEQE